MNKEVFLTKEILEESGFKKTVTGNFMINPDRVLLVYKAATNFWKIESESKTALIKTKSEFFKFLNNN